MEFEFKSHPGRVTADNRTAMLADPGFGRTFTDHMVVIRYKDGTGWHGAAVEPRAPLPLDPATAVLHYGQEIFEGMKAYRTADGGAALFRPFANANRFNRSADRLAMAQLPEEIFVEAVRQLVRADRDWIPDTPDGSLYLRPFMIASEPFLGVRPSREYLFVVIASAVGTYFKGTSGTVAVWVSDDYSRAGPGGTGAAKCGGNYAASLKAQAEAQANNCDQVIFLDAAERRFVEELGGMNVFFAMDDGSLVTPPLGDILPGITRDSIMALARDAGIAVREAPYTIEELRADARSGRLREAFACGTAAVITPIGTLRERAGEFTIGDGQAGELSLKLRGALVDIQRGRTNDPHGWMERVI